MHVKQEKLFITATPPQTPPQKNRSRNPGTSLPDHRDVHNPTAQFALCVPVSVASWGVHELFEQNLRHSHCQHRQRPWHKMDIHHPFNKYCNCGTFTVLCLPNLPASVVDINRHVNNIVHTRLRRAATVGSRLSPHRLHPRNLLDMHNRVVEHLINGLQLGNHCGVLDSLGQGKLPLSHDRDVDTLTNVETVAPGDAQQRASQEPVQQRHLKNCDGLLHILHCGNTCLLNNGKPYLCR